MNITRKNNINVRKTVERAINNHPEFHFFVDELSADDSMPTYAGLADEKYTFSQMDEGFFDFLNRKIQSDGIYLRICYLVGEIIDGEAIFTIEIAGEIKIFKTNDLDSVFLVDMADYGIKIMGDEITFGATVEQYGKVPYFAEFASQCGSEKFLSLHNPLNMFIISLIEEFLKD